MGYFRKSIPESDSESTDESESGSIEEFDPIMKHFIFMHEKERELRRQGRSEVPDQVWQEGEQVYRGIMELRQSKK